MHIQLPGIVLWASAAARCAVRASWECRVVNRKERLLSRESQGGCRLRVPAIGHGKARGVQGGVLGAMGVTAAEV